MKLWKIYERIVDHINFYSMPLFVPDASIILAFFLQEQEKGEKAKEFFLEVRSGDYSIILPSIWFYEVGNKLGRSESVEARKYRDLLCFYREHFFPTIETDESVTTLAFNLMGKYPSISFYDAIYHALAINLKAIFLTADKRYFALTKKEGSIEYF